MYVISNQIFFQTKLKAVINDLEKLTVAVSQLNLFSTNEQLDELSTTNMRFGIL